MKLSLPIDPQTTTPLREVGLYTGLTVALTWLFWLPGAFMPAPLGDMLLGIGSFVPLAVVVFLEIWLEKSSMTPFAWLRAIPPRALGVAVLLPIFIWMPVLLLRYNQGTLDVGKLFGDALGMSFSLVILLVLGIAEEVGWRGYLLPRLKFLPVYLTNLIVGVLWFVWQLPIIFAGRFNEAEEFGSFFIAMFLFALLITPFFNRLARRTDYNPVLPAILRAGTQFVVAVYFLQGRADPLTDTFGNLTIIWLVVLNVILFSQLWQGKKPPAEISELERVMPLGLGPS